MEWNKLLSEKRIRDLLKDKPATSSRPDERTNHGRDYDRAIFSTPVRRLQDKTQVFPLDPNDSVRTRLTHSLEVSNIARNMARGIGNWLKEKDEVDDRQKDSIEIIATTCGLIHDLGNPPFGHAGEEAIQEWFKNKLEKDEDFFESETPSGNVEQLKQYFLKFEGNAQTIRLISKLQVLADLHGLNFTCATMSAACKYIAPSDKSDKKKNFHEISKVGYFASEQDIVKKVQKETGTENVRNPITYIVEAADDIAFSVVDIEDGVKKGVISWDILEGKLSTEFETALTQYKQSDSGMLEFCFLNAKKMLEKEGTVKSVQESGKPRDNAMAQAFRVLVIIQTAKAIQETFREKYEDIMKGNYHSELFKDSKAGALIKACKEVGQKYIYCAKDNLKLELMGKQVIHDLMDIFWKGASKGSKEKKGFARKIFDLTSENYRVVYKEETKSEKFSDLYCCMHLMTDYICGMTDTFACTLHKRLTNG